MSKYIVVLITGPSRSVVRKIGLKIVKEKLAACVNIVPRVESIFGWQGRICRESETLMIVKTTSARFQKLEKRVMELHPYTVPEIIALPILKGSKNYLKWVSQMTR